MSISFVASSGLMTESLISRYSGFEHAPCLLPECKIQLFDSTESAGFLAKNPAFSAYLECMKRAGAPEGSVKINQTALTPCGDGVAIHTTEDIWAWVHQGWRSIDVVLRPPLQVSPNLNLQIMRAYQYTALFSDALLVHAAAIMVARQGILFCGVPGAGKSTQARLWEERFDAEALNNDQPCLVFQNDTVLVCGTPWSGKEPCYKNVSVPVRAIVFVEKSAQDRVGRLSNAEAFALLYLNEYVAPIQPGTEEHYHAAIEKTVMAVPVYRQYCTMTERAPETLRALLSL